MLTQNFRRNGAVAGDDILIIKRMNVGGAFCLCLGKYIGLVKTVAVEKSLLRLRRAPPPF